MKFTLFLLAILVTSVTYSQVITPTPRKNKSSVIFKKFDTIGKDTLYYLPPVRIGRNGAIQDNRGVELVRPLPNGNQVYVLPQDNMPCIVPNESLTSIPNPVGNPSSPYRYKGPDAIPNPAVPIELNPKKIIEKK